MDADYAPPYNNPPVAHQPPEPTPQQDLSRQDENVAQYTLSVEEASQAFKNAGIPRSPRTVIRYCSLKHLDCIKVDTERNEKYLVSPTSVSARIEELQQVIATSHVAQSPDTTRLNELQPDMSGNNDTRLDMTRNVDNEHVQQLESRVGELEREKIELARENEELKFKNRDLEITNRVKDNVIEKGERELSASRARLMRFNRAVGQLATLLSLKAPEEDTSKVIAYLDAPMSEAERDGDSFGDTSH